MHTVVETPEYLTAAKFAGMSEEERALVVEIVAAQPDAGVIIPGAGGARKLRVSKPNRGKSGGYRVITYFGMSILRPFC